MDDPVLAPLVRADLDLLREWFKDPETAARLGGMLPLEEWFENTKSLAGQANWLAYDGEAPVGHACLESYADGSASFALLVRPDLRRKGWGKRLAEAVIAHAKETGVTILNGYAEGDNAASIKLMESAGFRQTAGPDEDGFYTYSMELSGGHPA